MNPPIRVRITAPCPDVMTTTGESVQPSIDDVLEVPNNVAVKLILNGYAEPEPDIDDSVPPLSKCDGDQCLIGRG